MRDSGPRRRNRYRQLRVTVVYGGERQEGIWLSTWDETHFSLSQEEREGEEVSRLRIERFLQSRRMEFKVTFLLSSDRSFAYLALEGKPELATYASSM